MKSVNPTKNTAPSIIHTKIAINGLLIGNQRPPHIGLKGKMNPIKNQALYHIGSNHNIGVRIPAITGRYVNTEAILITNRLVSFFLLLIVD